LAQTPLEQATVEVQTPSDPRRATPHPPPAPPTYQKLHTTNGA
jgi:hypothetical protein